MNAFTFATCGLVLAALSQVALAQNQNLARHQAWAEGLIQGYLAGAEPPENLICPPENATVEGVRRSLSYFRSVGTTHFSVTKALADPDKIVQVHFTLKTPEGSTWAYVYVVSKNSSFCLRDAFSLAQMRDVAERVRNEIRNNSAKEIYKK